MAKPGASQERGRRGNQAWHRTSTGTTSVSRATGEPRFLYTLVALTFAMNLVARGVPETFAVFLLPVQKGLGVSRADITLTYSVYMLAYGLSGPFAGQLIDRFGARVAYGFGLASLGLGYFLAGFATELWHYHRDGRAARRARRRRRSA